MALSPTAVKYIAIAVILVVVGAVVLSALWEFLMTAIGILIGVGLVVIGFRVMFGKGLPKPIEKAVNKATGGEDKKPESK
ncbi:hypothetical protein OAU50_07465 [Planctomycetota bacterium]|nr:hypothetical protein [Planctomycetota bacterium]